MPDFATADGVRLHYTDEGTGLAVIALAGLTRAGSDFDFMDRALDGFRLIRLDYRGRGKSEWASPDSYTIAQEAKDTLALMDHLRLEKAAILGTSRGGLIAMLLAATAKSRLLGVALNDIGPQLDPKGLEFISTYIGKNPTQTNYRDLADARCRAMKAAFPDVPLERWRAEVMRHYSKTDEMLKVRYDPRLRDAVLAAATQPAPDLWPLFDTLDGLPLALIRGANSDLLSAATAAEMQRRRPDMIYAEVPNRGHVPFLDEDESLVALSGWLEMMR